MPWCLLPQTSELCKCPVSDKEHRSPKPAFGGTDDCCAVTLVRPTVEALCPESGECESFLAFHWDLKASRGTTEGVASRVTGVISVTLEHSRRRGEQLSGDFHPRRIGS